MKTIAVTSGKGGVGKTSLSVNLGVALSSMGYRAVIFDADLALANVEVMLGARAEHTLQHVIAEEKTLSEIVQRSAGGLGFIAGGSGVPMLMRAGPKRLNLFFEQVNGLKDSTDVLLFDTSAGLENRVLAFIKQADEVLLVTTPEPASVTDSYATIKTIFRQKPIAVINVVVNMASGESEAREVFDVLQRITKDFIKKEIHFVGFVRKDEQVSNHARLRQPFALSTKESPAKTDVTQLASRLVEGLESGSQAA